MKMLSAVALGILTAIGGFVDIGDLVANGPVGARRPIHRPPSSREHVTDVGSAIRVDQAAARWVEAALGLEHWQHDRGGADPGGTRRG